MRRLAGATKVEVWQIIIGVTAIASTVTRLPAEEGLSVNSRVELALGDYAKLMCSAVFISGRNLEEAERNSGPLVTENFGSSYPALSESERAANTKVIVDYKRKLVRANAARSYAPNCKIIRRPRMCDPSQGSEQSILCAD